MRTCKLFILIISFGFVIPTLGLAKQERLEIVSRDKQIKKSEAKVLLREVDLSKVEDPTTQAALGAIFKILNVDRNVTTKAKTIR